MSNKNNTLFGLWNGLIVPILIGVTLLVCSCNEQARGFALPTGDIEKGKAAYKRLDCASCHNISGIAWKGGSDSLKIQLGGQVPSKKSYGELVTSVINPSHKIAPGYDQKFTTQGDFSKMDNYNYIMTVQELVDLVTFLQSEYQVETPTTNYYPYY
ncbi:hypothetical protein MTsPCn9_29060 [Croceitalea sp. MTPC9]|uniref:cytochrome c n=1 Tax=unclassified Croceitalea TaxID=2632280 RepID=UPI002B395464|nr:hypothetical protein MTsPCn6_30550 [Croceitalea sp. MTPC6]GMN17966.1 hypothetical protein MTsPCn9_29060 [Croceitalea sp. MTPC9]